jgi:hypothetical protein
MTPTVSVFSLSMDSTHLLGMVSFHGLGGDASRNMVMSSADNADGFTIAPAGNQAHLPNPEPYVSEADRILRGILALTFPAGGLGSEATS